VCFWSVLHGDIVSKVVSIVQLAWSADFEPGFLHGFSPLGNPSHSACHCKHHCEHREREADGREDQSRVEVHVGEQFAADELVVTQRNLLQLHGQLEHARIVFVLTLLRVQNVVAVLAHDFSAGVLVLVHAVAEPHESERVVLVFGPQNKFGNVFFGAYLVQHLQDGFIGPSVERSPETRDATRDARLGIGETASGDAHCGGGGILFVVGMEEQEGVDGSGKQFGHLEVADVVVRENHVKQILALLQIVLGAHEGQADGVALCHRSDGGQLGYQSGDGDVPVQFTVNVQIVVEERRHGCHHTHHD